MLDCLPPELLRMVFTYVQNKSHLLALSRVSRKYRSLIFPRIFEVLTIKSYDKRFPWELERYPYFDWDVIAKVPKVLATINQLQICTQFELTDLVEVVDDIKRHPYFLTRDSSTSSIDSSSISQEDNSAVIRKRQDIEGIREMFDSENGDYGMIKLGTKMIRLLSALPDNQLISFRWDMGICLPNALLGEEGYLVTHQSRIQKLALTTEGGSISGGLPLKKFTNLRELTLRGLLSDDDCVALKTFLVLHHERLAYLEVDLIDWEAMRSRFDLPDDDEDEDEDEDESDSTPLTDLMFPERKDNYEGFLPNLQTFSLSAASFKGSWDRLINAFNLRNVGKLRLLNCKFAVELLDYMARTDVSLQANNTELVLPRSEVDGMEFDVIDFLAPFDGLENLFLMCESDYADEHYTAIILRHRDTLRRLVFHRRHYCLAEKSPYWEEYCDSSLEETEGGGFIDILRETKLECVGVYRVPSKLQNSFQNMVSTINSLKLLHLRFTGKVERKPKFFEESEAYDDDSPSLELDRADLKVEWNGTTPLRRLYSPGETEFKSGYEQIQGENWREDEEKELEAFANWAFGPDGFPCLQVLASGDFSYGNRFADTQTLWCRKTRGSRRKQTWRPVEPCDIAENELIDANMDMMSACPVSPLFYRYGRGDLFPGIS